MPEKMTARKQQAMQMRTRIQKAALDLFDAVYPNVESADGENVVAPGTEGSSIVRLKNSVKGSVKYTAVLYRIRTSENLPVEAGLGLEGHTPAESYGLPQGVEESQVIKAVKGSIRGGEIKDFDISWLWDYYESAEQDRLDTLLGIEPEADRVAVGLYIVVEDNNSYTNPTLPQTGDDSRIGMYLTLMGISGVLLILLLIDRRREKK